MRKLSVIAIVAACLTLAEGTDRRPRAGMSQ